MFRRDNSIHAHTKMTIDIGKAPQQSLEMMTRSYSTVYLTCVMKFWYKNILYIWLCEFCTHILYRLVCKIKLKEKEQQIKREIEREKTISPKPS